jgi:hypothetical protein
MAISPMRAMPPSTCVRCNSALSAADVLIATSLSGAVPMLRISR